MKKLLISGFMPFGGEEINPSWEAVRCLPDEIGGFALSKMLLPVVFGEAAQMIANAASELMPDAILCIGQAGGRGAITPELVAINLKHASIPDNAGNQPTDEPIDKDGENAYFSTLSVREMARAISERGIASQVSYSAGTYVCNEVLYTLLRRFQGTGTRVAFVHIPYSTEQGKEPAMSLSDVVKGLAYAIEAIDS